MRRHGGLWEKIVSPENMAIAYRKAALCKSTRKNVQKFALNLEGNLERIRLSLIDKTFATSHYTEKKVYEPKERTIYVLPFAPDRIVQHALMNVVSPVWEKLFIQDSYACIENRGIHAGSRRVMEFVRKNKYVLKCDISRFYPSVNQEILLDIIKKKIKCKNTLWLVEDIVQSFPGGKNVPIGNYTSQWFGNLYLNELDSYVKHEFRVRDYIRYCDDFCLFHDDKTGLHEYRIKIRQFLDERLDLKFSKSEVFPVKQGVDFLGYRHFDNYILLRKSTSKRVRKRLARLPGLYGSGRITAEQYRSSVASTWGWLKHANTHNLAVATDFRRMMEEVSHL
jgi:retron-type reverse transcriptase